MVGLVLILILLLLGGVVCGYVAVIKLSSLRIEVERLRHQLETGNTRQPARPVSSATKSRTDDSVTDELAKVESPQQAAMPDGEPSARMRSAGPGPLDRLIEHMRSSWMIWLGGSCVTLAGIFFLRYSIEQGLLGPTARIVVALLFGIACHAVAEYLRRRDGETTAALAALAGAGSITLYAALLASFRLYELVGAGTAFLFMALVAGATMVMARLHGPLLAAFGIVGAYLVPILLSTGGGGIRIALLYSLIVSGSALLLMRYVYRPWLWWGFATGALGWWLISTGQSEADELAGQMVADLAEADSGGTFGWPVPAITSATC